MPPAPTNPIMRQVLPPRRRAAICFSVDDVCPAKASDGYEAGGDLHAGALGHLTWLLDRHPQAKATLFTTPDWRMIKPWPTRKILKALPFLRDQVFLTPTRPQYSLRLDRHPQFVAYLKSLPGVEIAIHGLHHVHPGLRVPVEFQNQTSAECLRILETSKKIFADAGLPYAPGMTPPAWNLPPALATAMVRAGFLFVSSARDTETPIHASAAATMSGLRGVSLVYPEAIENGRLLHFPVNFQATNDLDRAIAILECGGILNIKAHIVKKAFGYVALDGMDELYRNYLDLLFRELDRRYGSSLWWTSMGEFAARWCSIIQKDSLFSRGTAATC